MKGRFQITLPSGEIITVPNIITSQGEESFLKMITRADVAEVAAGGNWYIGLCEEIVDKVDTLVGITTEPTGAGGYARKAVERDATGWPTIAVSGPSFRALTKQVDFAASGANFSRTFTRLFLTNVASGTAGRLFAYSGALATPLLVLDGQTHSARYELYLR